MRHTLRIVVRVELGTLPWIVPARSRGKRWVCRGARLFPSPRGRPHLVTNAGETSAVFLVLQGIGEYDFVPVTWGTWIADDGHLAAGSGGITAQLAKKPCL